MMIFKHLVMGWIQLRLIVFASFYGIFICGLFLEKIVGNIRDNNPGKKSPEDTSWFDTHIKNTPAINLVFLDLLNESFTFQLSTSFQN
jgi:hypothetical protein